MAPSGADSDRDSQWVRPDFYTLGVAQCPLDSPEVILSKRSVTCFYGFCPVGPYSISDHVFKRVLKSLLCLYSGALFGEAALCDVSKRHVFCLQAPLHSELFQFASESVEGAA